MKTPKKIQHNLLKLTEILNDHNYHDGVSIGANLKLTRSAIWKIIKKLQGYGINITSTKGKGYLLEEPLLLINPFILKKNLANNIDISVFESITSTNDYLKQFKNNEHIKICLAEQQTAGRGRFNRHWHSPFGKNIYFSCLYNLEKDISELAGLSLVVSLALVECLREFGINDLFVKWSNDIIFNDKKLAGNLIELQAETNASCQAIIGIGLNVNMIQDSNDILKPWTSLQNILNCYINRNDLLIILINKLIIYLKKFTKYGFSAFIDEWHAKDYLYNKNISLKIFNKAVLGKAKGVSEQGYLLLELPSGEVISCSSGDATLDSLNL